MRVALPTSIAPAEQVFTQLIQLLVRYPERVSATIVSTALEQTIQIAVDTADLGSVIGRQGRTARSLRILLAAISARADHRIVLDIAENPIVGPAV